jgi:hypothetical protein
MPAEVTTTREEGRMVPALLIFVPRLLSHLSPEQTPM